ncbi:sigma-70 family RNA polymerase sigma factor [Actinopolymorpha pittospori]|uniref:RNA polymerase sigma-70 factor (ECF subfamily) n=1 Tax=Actinopolymorpha pittospori TaxID=648752 RepID=A0A927RR17_9ACTN|nr:sigma-70 family RNA polymerase sigma factor [Actinopolymorpha pittospori]MBE1612858.1 RNA polymerase sigma-70 factor (ECF subfamily) [Actinopolymorpha pittospori]
MTDFVAVEHAERDALPRGSEELGHVLERHRLELTGYCYRMLGSAFESEDAVQETLLRAWRSFEHFEERSTLRTWLFRIATNVCLDMLSGSQRRARPMDLSPARTSLDTALPAPLPESAWIQPIPDSQVVPAGGDPAEVAVARETIRLAFVATLHYLPPRQRAVLILRDVLRWRASEVADLLDTSVASVNSALQRARATLATSDMSVGSTQPDDEAQRDLLARYVDAFERYDIESLVALLHEDATLSMPPFPLWLHGPADIGRWMLGPGIGCQGSRLIPVAVNGCAAFGQYRSAGPEGGHTPFALQVIEVRDGRIVAINAHLDTDLVYPLVGLPTTTLS